MLILKGKLKDFDFLFVRLLISNQIHWFACLFLPKFYGQVFQWNCVLRCFSRSFLHFCAPIK